jgi:integrase
LEQYKTISDAGYKWVDEAAGKPYHWKRWMTHHYFNIMTLTGMRVNEARYLKWGDIEPFKDKNGDTNIRLHVLQTKTRGKPKRRKAVPFIRASYWFWHLRTRPWHTADDDLVFCKRDGQPYRDLSRGFNRMLERAGITHDRDGKKYTIYSLRHTFFTFQLYHGEGASLFEIAKTGGTSTKQLQDTYIKADSTLSAPKLRGLAGDGKAPAFNKPAGIAGDAAKRRKKKADIVKHPHALNQV